MNPVPQYEFTSFLAWKLDEMGVRYSIERKADDQWDGEYITFRFEGNPYVQTIQVRIMGEFSPDAFRSMGAYSQMANVEAGGEPNELIDSYKLEIGQNIISTPILQTYGEKSRNMEEERLSLLYAHWESFLEDAFRSVQ